jgi:hypothetical protein
MHIEDIQSSPAMKTWSMMQFVIAATPCGGPMPTDGRNGSPGDPLRLTALPVEQAVALLRRSGSQRLTVEDVRADIAAGAPVNRDGTLNLIAYGAWMVRALAEREADHGG